MRIGVDAGGTFTDFVVVEDNGRLSTFKLRSNPIAPARVILQGIEHAAVGRSAEVVHGSTVATNALLERKGARTAFVTTAGFEDLLEIGRQNRRAENAVRPWISITARKTVQIFGLEKRAKRGTAILVIPDKPVRQTHRLVCAFRRRRQHGSA